MILQQLVAAMCQRSAYNVEDVMVLACIKHNRFRSWWWLLISAVVKTIAFTVCQEGSR